MSTAHVRSKRQNLKIGLEALAVVFRTVVVSSYSNFVCVPSMVRPTEFEPLIRVRDSDFFI